MRFGAMIQPVAVAIVVAGGVVAYLIGLVLVLGASLLRLRPESRKQVGLTEREFEVLEHVEIGLSNRQIAAELGIEEDTVAKHLHNAYRKLGVSSRTQALHRLAELDSGS